MNKKYPVKEETVETSAKPGGARSSQKSETQISSVLVVYDITSGTINLNSACYF